MSISIYCAYIHTYNYIYITYYNIYTYCVCVHPNVPRIWWKYYCLNLNVKWSTKKKGLLWTGSFILLKLIHAFDSSSHSSIAESWWCINHVIPTVTRSREWIKMVSSIVCFFLDGSGWLKYYFRFCIFALFSATIHILLLKLIAATKLRPRHLSSDSGNLQLAST